MNTKWAQYEKRLLRVSEYIHDHLDDALDMELLSQVACLSVYHWHRIYRAIYGETVTATIKRLRLNRAAHDLIRLNIPIAKIAEQAGYPNLPSFNRTFKKAYGLPPGQFRAMGGTGIVTNVSGKEKSEMFDVKITQWVPITLAGIMFTGPYSQVGKAFEQLNGLAATRGLHGPDQRVIGIYYDDPNVIEETKLRTFAGISIPEEISVKPPLETATIAGGKYAVFRYQGPYSGFEDCYEWIYGEWLKNCQYDLRDEPGFAQYLNPAHTIPSELLSDI
ncbi:MAG: AraC family transcriptional regulator, partial [Hyphomicrobiales bacterium]|nr:AraC family transcriptional regulator [Hyphomicrobiales bacterium]